MLVRLEGEEQKRELMREKSNIKRKEERIVEDWTWKERNMRWLKKIAKERKGNSIWTEYRKFKFKKK